nr:hypothetical protein BaRGS_011256 [Batillaria attramentaria]
MYWRLSEEERMILTLLSSAYENTVLSTLKERQTFPQFEMSKFTATDYLDEYDRQFRLMVSFVKQLEDFQKLKLDDQIACFKGSVGTVSLVRGAFVFVVERKAWIMVKGELTVEHMRNIFPDNSFLDWSTEVCHRLKNVAKNDIILYALLHCILLFDPSIDKLADRQAVSVSRAKYIVLLRHYVESVFSYAYADDYMRFFQDMIVETRQLYKATVMAAKKKECSNTEECERYKFLMEIFSDSYS